LINTIVSYVMQKCVALLSLNLTCAILGY